MLHEESKEPFEQPINLAANAVQQSELLRQILMVGSLFNSRVFQVDEQQSTSAPPVNQEQRIHSNIFNDSDDSDEVKSTPEQIRSNMFEKCLKQRIFLSDRIEKIEKVLIKLDIIHKDVNFCSQS